ncbi:hypothetical protein GC175_31435 [bacterium]|nr:hypothetical protein [bacterium]
MNHLFEAFLLGNGAILTNVCLLPLYPGLLAFLAGRIAPGSTSTASRWLGIFVLAGIISLMLVLGALLFGLQQSFSSLLPYLLPAIYGLVIVLGIAMLLGRNPFKGLSTVQSPVLRNPFAAAYVYGLLLGPMTLPCTGPLVISVFLLGAGNVGQLADGLLYFLAFGLGFGWPLVLLPFVAQPLQRRFTGWMTQNVVRLTQVSGALLVLIGIFGIYAEVLPNL